jgi:predicted unusual protein kinase regulating ubiquinone biosynthesis (AarF/ABC1/UbiB family)
MNLLWFLTTVIQYKFAWDKTSSIAKMKQILEESGAVWQKFGQMISTHEELIGRDLAIEMQKMLFDCPVHTDKYSRDIIRKMFGDKYDLKEMELIGSGTIAQVYKVGDKCIKVRHPNVVSEVMDAVANYDSIKYSYFMPVIMKMVCDVFFEGLVAQLDFHNEFANGNIFKELIHGGTDGTNNLFIIPRMLDTSEECLVMEYVPSQSIILSGRNKIDRHTLLRSCVALSILGYIGYGSGFLHGDIHFGNYGIRGNQIVIYDFGYMVDVRGQFNHLRFIQSTLKYDFDIVIDECNLSDKDKNGLRHYLGENKRGDVHYYYNSFKKISIYLVINNIKINPGLVKMLTTMKNNQSHTKILFELEKDDDLLYYNKHVRTYGRVSLYDKYFPYDDVKNIRDTIKLLL